jgi:Uma2 family endonuclease
MSAVAQRLITAEEFLLLPPTERQRELVRGEVVETMPPNARHGRLAVKIAVRLETWSEQGKHGVVGVESGFTLSKNPDVVRFPDVYFIRAERVPPTGVPDAFWTIAPNLAVEVVSPSESAADVQEKVRDYLQAGTPLMWVIYPRSEQVVVHTTDGVARTLSGDDLLASSDVLPGFGCTVRQIFE